MTAWYVFAATADDDGNTVGVTRAGLWLNCGHAHAERIAAEGCTWEPDDAPEVYAGLVLEVHQTYFARFSQGRMPWPSARCASRARIAG